MRWSWEGVICLSEGVRWSREVPEDIGKVLDGLKNMSDGPDMSYDLRAVLEVSGMCQMFSGRY